jgi:predicted GNAT superfamily acetyltransferase
VSEEKGERRIRPATEADFDSILRLNAEWEHFMSGLDLASLTAMHHRSAYHRVVEIGGRVVAFLITLREGADYDSPNYRYFDRDGRVFLYIDRVVVDGPMQGEGLATLLYDDVLDFARQSGVERVVCELDIDPPNEVSRAFHDAYGFREVDTQWVAGGRKRVSLRGLDVG